MASKKDTTPAPAARKARAPRSLSNPQVDAHIDLAIRLLSTARDQIDTAPAQAKTLIVIVLEGLNEIAAKGGAK